MDLIQVISIIEDELVINANFPVYDESSYNDVRFEVERFCVQMLSEGRDDLFEFDELFHNDKYDDDNGYQVYIASSKI